MTKVPYLEWGKRGNAEIPRHTEDHCGLDTGK